MPLKPAEYRLTLTPRARYDAIDIARSVEQAFGEYRREYRKALYGSHHTTAGFLERSLSHRLAEGRHGVDNFIGAFQTLFPPDAAYRHDQLELRDELSPEQRRVEPRNADSHLTFIGSGMLNCVTYPNHPDEPVYFIELDGTNGQTPRMRTTTVIAYDREETVERVVLEVPVSRHPIDSINLNDRRLGLMDRVQQLLAAHGIEKGRIDFALAPGEGRAALTVNEYETLLMQHDLIEVLRNPFKFAAEKSRNMLLDPFSIPGKTRSYAKYDLVQVINRLLEALRMDDSAVERLLARFLAMPAERFFRMKRSISFPLSDREDQTSGRIVRGTYQSPILVQWGAADNQVRRVEVTLVRFE